jgi:hypothetical protein
MQFSALWTHITHELTYHIGSYRDTTNEINRERSSQRKPDPAFGMRLEDFCLFEA